MILAAGDVGASPTWPNWYVGLHGSLVFIDEVNVGGNPTLNNFEQDTGWGLGGSIGYRPAADGGNWRNLRLELEWHHQRADVDKVKTFGGSFNATGGDVRVDALMMNLFFDATFRDPGLKSTFTPYFGGGAGLATVKLDDTFDLGNTAEKDDVFAFQLMTGVTYAPELIPYTEWSLGYRYFNTTDASFAYVGGGKMEVDYDSHNLEAGVRFLF